MTDFAPITAHNGRIGPGRLVLLVGPSGAGKDTLLGIAKATCLGKRDIVFARRVITREPSPAEDNLQSTPEAFRAMIAGGEFALHWQAHGHSYGVLRSIDNELRAGHTVVANVSRTVIALARQTYENVTVVLVTAPEDILANRIAARARRSDGISADRIGRTVGSSADADFTILNVASRDDHARELVEIICDGDSARRRVVQ
ncbi:Phosphonate metabolism, 1,5-bisphosphokinase (PRPP-forming) PhnN [Rhodopseudomonas palustris HaA2]|uniref:Ribose 1,5-bisphosphate phosphokinase PhnN n=1 Tax=Rhodopseudomonas palustris (strain HaA2) TaxID=316058 RepID=Q2ISM1_RHOP2|nr:phosphonate metabolism protein/1,5-bisphosphokinase (PRPP-forming) PhnN [Rhodopseudomonas palustris]ABD08789.1 Phosphonate metabolism, 1,5-bisphosphokinase (PRPP-forming) PhnN [Rhodopseudomonas palustris HaA2]